MKPKLFEPLSGLSKPDADDFYAKCHVLHDEHNHKFVTCELAYVGKIGAWIYDWTHYFTTMAGNETTPKYAEYCPGQDIISYCIDRQGVWEKEETAIMLDILGEPNADKIMLDFGSHIGWYSNMALKMGYRVASFDANQENLDLLEMSSITNATSESSYPYLCWLDSEAPILQPDAEEVQLVKVDVEGAEHHVLQMCSLLFGRHRIKYAIFEISPVFNGNYPALVRTIIDCGYDVYQLPAGHSYDAEAFAADPLGYTLNNCELKQRGELLSEYIDGLHQENFLFVRRDSA